LSPIRIKKENRKGKRILVMQGSIRFLFSFLICGGRKMNKEDLRAKLMGAFAKFASISEAPSKKAIKKILNLICNDINSTGLVCRIINFEYPEIEVDFLGYNFYVYESCYHSERICACDENGITLSRGPYDCVDLFIEHFKINFPGVLK
jgi:hypothetical protein